MTRNELAKIMPRAGSRVDLFFQPLLSAMAEFAIDTPAREAAFLAQVGHESGQLLYVRELASGQAYEGRKDLGNAEPGDGVRFKGRGLIQITGRDNYLKCSQALFRDDRLIQFPELLEDPVYACRSASWFWQSKGLNELADRGDFLKISIRINGRNKSGLPNGWEDRQALHSIAMEVLT